MAVANTDSPFWAEEFQFDSKLGFKDLKFLVMLEKTNGGISTVPVGKVCIPRGVILKNSEEQTFLLEDASLELKVTGRIQLIIKHFPPKPPRKSHGFSVNVVRAEDLDHNGDDIPNPFVAVHILPDPTAITTHLTHIHEETNDPIFEEVFFFTCAEGTMPHKREINCSIWSNQENADTGTSPIFLGHVTIPLGPVVAKSQTIRWYPLNALSDDSEFMCVTKKGKKGYHAASSSATEEKKGLKEVDENRVRVRDFIRSLSLTSGNPCVSERAHSWVDKSFGLANCSHCSRQMIGVHSSCSECNVITHHKCAPNIPNTCRAMGTLRVKISTQKLIAFDRVRYSPLIDVLTKDDYYILILLGKVSSYREEVARCMIRILDSSYIDFVKNAIKQEIMKAPDSQTLFRANSMASKALDVLMKYEGSDYLQQTIENILKVFVMSKRPCELDPTRLEGSQLKKKEESLEANKHNLIELNTIITDCIFSSGPKMPNIMRDIFHFISQTVEEKFSEDMVKYTSISGFLFLRFFAPAILGPHLFNLKVGVLDAVSSRKLLLIAKIIQNLSNFVEFGQKEPFMDPMNPFIQSRMPRMKKFIDEISCPLSTPNTTYKRVYREVDVAQDTAELSKLLLASMDKLIGGVTPPSPLLAEMSQILADLEAKIMEVEARDKEASLVYDMGLDLGIDENEGSQATEDLPGNIQSDDIMLMLSKIKSSVANNPESIPDSGDNKVPQFTLFSSVPDISVVLNNSKLEFPEDNPVVDGSAISESLTHPEAEEPLFKTPQMSTRRRVSVMNVIAHVFQGASSPNITTASSVQDLTMEIPEQEIANKKITGKKKRGSIVPSFDEFFSPIRLQSANSGSSPTIAPILTSSLGKREESESSNSSIHSAHHIGMNRNEAKQKEPSSLMNQIRIEASPTQSRRNFKESMNFKNSQEANFTPLIKIKSAISPSSTGEIIDPSFADNTVLSPISNRTSLHKSFSKYQRKVSKSNLFDSKDPAANKAPSCWHCKILIDDTDYVEIDDMRFHYQCMTCSVCGTDLDDEAYSYNNDICCRKDFFISSDLICKKCDEQIMEEFVVVRGKKYHPDCRECSFCQGSLLGRPYIVMGNSVFCYEHNDFITCFTCQKKIEGELIESNRHFYHRDHFACHLCKKDLNGSTVHELNDAPYCQRCFLKFDAVDDKKHKHSKGASYEGSKIQPGTRKKSIFQ